MLNVLIFRSHTLQDFFILNNTPDSGKAYSYNLFQAITKEILTGFLA